MIIKFRAWDRGRKEMLYVQKLDFAEWSVRTYDKNRAISQFSEKSLDYCERNSFENKETDRHILMQYINKKDKHDNEIYDGDRVRFNDVGEECAYEGYPEGYDFINEATVYFNEKYLKFELKDFRESINSYIANDGFIEYFNWEDCEIVGNIYE